MPIWTAAIASRSLFDDHGSRRSPASKVGMMSLGCAKNLVDAEIMLGDAVAGGFEITADADEADIIVVNTCGLIESAKQESIERSLKHAGSLARSWWSAAVSRSAIAINWPASCPRWMLSSGWIRSRTQAKSFVACSPLRRKFRPGGFHPGRDTFPTTTRHGSGLPRPYRLREDRRGLQPSLQLLRFPQMRGVTGVARSNPWLRKSAISSPRE